MRSGSSFGKKSWFIGRSCPKHLVGDEADDIGAKLSYLYKFKSFNGKLVVVYPLSKGKF